MSKIVKYIICAILTVGAFSFISEVYAWYLYDFETQYTYVTFYAPAGADSRQMKEDLSAAAKDNDVSIFVVERKIESSFHVDVNIYAMPEAAEKLMSNQIRDGNYKSLFLGDYSIRLREFSELSDPTKYTEFQLVGESENITDLKKTLVDEYGGAFPREGYASFNSGSAVMLVWGIVFAFLLLMTMYETAVKKKETVVRLISGQSIGHYAMKNILTDLAAYTALFLSVGILSCIMVNGDYCLGRTLFMMVLFLILNSLVYLWLLSVNYKKDIAGRSGLKGVLKVSYIYKTAFMLIVVLLLSGSVSLIYEGAEHRMQRDFFERYGDYYYPMISSRPDADEATSEEVGRIGDEFHLTHLKQGKALTMQYIGYEEGNDNYIFSNGAALSYITDKIPELKVWR